MADTYTASLRLQQPTVGGDAASWGGYLNTDLVLIDNAMCGVAQINLAGLANYTLTAVDGQADQARNAAYNFTGVLTSNCTVTLPGRQRFGYAINSTTGGHTIVLTTGSGATLTLPTAAWYQFFYCDGVNVVSPSIGFAYANFQNNVAISGTLNVTGATALAAMTAATVNASQVAASSSMSVGGATWVTNGDGFIPYLNANRSAILNQPLLTSSSPSFSDVNLSGLGFLKASFINQPVLTTSNPTFGNVTVSNVTVGGSASLGGLNVSGGANIGGNLGVSSALTVGGSIGAATLSLNGSFSGSTSGWQLNPTGTGAFSGGFNLSIGAAQGVLGNTFIAASDARVKEDIAEISVNEGLRFVRKIGAKTYVHDGALSGGFLAQDILRNGFERMVIVSDSDDARVAKGDDVSPAGRRLNLNYDHATAYHHAALQGLLDLVHALQDEIAALKAKLP